MINKIILGKVVNVSGRNNISRLFSGMLIISLSLVIFFSIPSQVAFAGWIRTSWFSGGNWFWDDILGIDPKEKKDKTPQIPAVIASCSVIPSITTIGNPVIWSVSASGGTGSYSYSWSGSDSLSGAGSTLVKTYSSAGVKTGIIVVTSGSQSITRTCSAYISASNNNSGDIPDAETENVQNVTENSVRIKGSINMNDYQNGRVFFIYGEDRDLINDVKDDHNTYGEIDEEGDDLRKVSITSNLNGSDSFSYNVRNLNNNTDYYYTICVQYRNENGNNRLNCGRVRKFTTEVSERVDLYASCYANPSNPQVGTQVNWYCDVSGGIGSYSYSWSGSDGLNSTNRSPYIVYNSPGTKTATVVIRDGDGNRITRTVYVNINSVLGITQPSQPYLPLASAVYLSQIPSTGLADNYKLSFFLGFIAFLSAWIAYIIISYNKGKEDIKYNL